ncbi:MAG: hypothetical protein H7Y22_11550 [Gemmatimonadaceae bacterium]|nr:hypothetical protein [Gloeobacterales cyanobacterium ES-bin-141]
MLTPTSREIYTEASIGAAEHPVCELFPATRMTGRLFAAGVGMGFTSLFLDGLGAGPWAWAVLAAGGLTLLFAGSQVVQD